VNKDIKDINEQYKLGINHTKRNIDGYKYPATDYAVLRSEQEEDSLKSQLSLDLNNMLKRSQRGLLEDYKYILIMLDKVKKDITSLL
jgi:hypothetical protein